MNRTPIEWCDFTANPLKFRNTAGDVVWGCVHASPGCTNCYAETLARRYGRGGPFNVSTMAGLTPFLDDAELRKMITAKRVAGLEVSGSRCFVGDMTDVFGQWVPDEMLDRLFAVFHLRRDVTWQVLTKRSDRLRSFLCDVNRRDSVAVAALELCDDLLKWDSSFACVNAWPLPNVWLGVSCEDQQRADERIPLLLQTPAAVRFISAEPLIGRVDLAGALGFAYANQDTGESVRVPAVDWVIVGGESGPGARPCHLPWIRSIVGQCAAAQVPMFVKQIGSHVTHDLIYGQHDFSGEQPIHTERAAVKDRKGGDMSEWPADLRVRQFPAVNS